jgi:hypothetical protein
MRERTTTQKKSFPKPFPQRCGNGFNSQNNHLHPFILFNSRPDLSARIKGLCNISLLVRYAHQRRRGVARCSAPPHLSTPRRSLPAASPSTSHTSSAALAHAAQHLRPPPSTLVRAHACPVPPRYCVLRPGTPVPSSLAAVSPPRTEPALCLPPVRCHAFRCVSSAHPSRPSPPLCPRPARLHCLTRPAASSPRACLSWHTRAAPCPALPFPSRLRTAVSLPAATPVYSRTRAPTHVPSASTLPPPRVPAHATPNLYHHAASRARSRLPALPPRARPTPHPIPVAPLPRTHTSALCTALPVFASPRPSPSVSTPLSHRPPCPADRCVYTHLP